jgi:hypothetical protein
MPMPAETNQPDRDESSAGAGVVPLDASFDDAAIDRFVQRTSELTGEHRHLIIDATHNRWLGPVGLVSLFVIGDSLRERDFPKPQLLVPTNADTRAYWGRMGVARYAGDYFQVRGDLASSEGGRDGPLIALVRLQPGTDMSVEENPRQDLFERVMDLLRNELGLGAARAMSLAMELLEVAVEMMEESGTAVWYSTQTYFWKAKLGRKVAVFAIGCHGYRLRVALREQYAGINSLRWDDAMALEAALLHGVTRFSDSRPRGFARLRRAVDRLDGRLTVRSGTARVSIIPSWDQGDPLVTELPECPGTLLTLAVPDLKQAER